MRLKKKTVDDIKAIKSPYLAARREWNERYGGYISAAKNWRGVGIISLLLAAVCVGGVIYFASQNKLIPYVVEVDSRGNTVTVYKATEMKTVNPNIIKANLGQFIRDLRSVSADMTVQKAAIYRLYTHLKSNTQASIFVDDFFIANSPFKRAEKRTVSVDILQLLPLSDTTWQIEWSEQEFSRDGKRFPKTSYTATATISVGNDVDEKTILLNPIGMMIDNLHWSADFNNKDKRQ